MIKFWIQEVCCLGQSQLLIPCEMCNMLNESFDSCTGILCADIDVLEATSHKTTAVWPLTSDLKNHTNDGEARMNS